jgi:NADPH:quinone reductase-like Zn-dependent oxidoreductase
MKAAVYHKYGTPDVIRVEDVEKPSPKGSEALVQIKAVSLNSYDWRSLT